MTGSPTSLQVQQAIRTARGSGWRRFPRLARHRHRRKQRREAWEFVTRPLPAWERHFERLTGVSPEEQRLRRMDLYRANAIRAIEAYRYGLLLDDDPLRWTPFITDSAGHLWNQAASAVLLNSRPGQPARDLADKALTAQLLHKRGVPVVPHLGIAKGAPMTQVRMVVDQAVERWESVFAKPRYGSGGQGSLIIRGHPPEGQSHTTSGSPTAFATAELLAVLTTQDYLLQPRFTGSGLHAEELPDTINLRVVTRDIGEGPRLFSCTAEIPFRTQEGIRFAALAAAGQALTHRDVGTAPWLPDRRCPQRQATVGAWSGHAMPEIPAVISSALTAHETFAGLFAIAWDVAITSFGPLFLEGNAGFGIDIPQIDAGGLLAGLEGNG